MVSRVHALRFSHSETRAHSFNYATSMEERGNEHHVDIIKLHRSRQIDLLVFTVDDKKYSTSASTEQLMCYNTRELDPCIVAAPS